MRCQKQLVLVCRIESEVEERGGAGEPLADDDDGTRREPTLKRWACRSCGVR